VKKQTVGTHKKAIVFPLAGKSVQGYINPGELGRSSQIELLSTDGEYVTLELTKIKTIHFVREFTNLQPPERKTFLSRPKLEGLWVRCTFRDQDVIEGIVANNLVEIAEHGVRLTPPDLHGNTLWIFIPSTALAEVTVLGVVGIARRRKPAAAPDQPKLFDE
jgi:uncharacterized protein DUF6982